MQAPERINIFFISKFCVRPEAKPSSGFSDGDGIKIRDFDQNILCVFGNSTV